MEIRAKKGEEQRQKDLARLEAMKNTKGGKEDTRTPEQRAKDNEDIIKNSKNPNHVLSKYKLDSLDGSIDDETGRQDGKPVDKEEFAKRLDAQNKQIDSETEAQRAKRNSGSTRSSNNAAEKEDSQTSKAKNRGKSREEKKTDSWIDSVLNSKDDDNDGPSDADLKKIEKENAKDSKKNNKKKK